MFHRGFGLVCIAATSLAALVACSDGGAVSSSSGGSSSGGSSSGGSSSGGSSSGGSSSGGSSSGGSSSGGSSSGGSSSGGFDAGSGCSAAARGVIDTILPAQAAGAGKTVVHASVGAQCNEVYIAREEETASGVGNTVLTKCSLPNCAATATTIPTPTGLSAGANFRRTPAGLFAWGSPRVVPSYRTSGGMVQFPLGGSPIDHGVAHGDPFARGLIAVLGNHALIGFRAAPYNHGDWRQVDLVTLAPATKVMNWSGGEVTGVEPVQTPTRLMLLERVGVVPAEQQGQIKVVDPATGALSPFAAGRIFKAWALGERIVGVLYATGGGATLPGHFACESDTTCAAPIRHDTNVLEPTASRAYIGPVGNELVFVEGLDSDSQPQVIKSCSLAQLTGATPCVPNVIATLPAATLPRLPSIMDNGKDLFFVDRARNIRRLGL